eukprot:gene7549-7055_t
MADGAPSAAAPAGEGAPAILLQQNNQRVVDASPAPKKKPGGKKPSMKCMKKVNQTPVDPERASASGKEPQGCKAIVAQHLAALSENNKCQIGEEDLDFVELLGVPQHSCPPRPRRLHPPPPVPGLPGLPAPWPPWPSVECPSSPRRPRRPQPRNIRTSRQGR